MAFVAVIETPGLRTDQYDAILERMDVVSRPSPGPNRRHLTVISPALFNGLGASSLAEEGDTGRAMSQENVEIVRRFLVVDDFDEALTHVDPGIVWNPVEESSAQGHDAVRASTARWKSEWDDYELIPEEFADIGDRVVVTVRFRARGRGSGVEVDARLYDVFTLRDGKIVRMDQFAEQSEALEAVRE